MAWMWLFQTGLEMRAADQAAVATPDMSGMAGMNMAGMPDMPGMAMGGPPAALAPAGPAYLFSAFAMWLLMMVAMMLPSAAPMILLYERFAKGVKRQGRALAPTFLFAATYLGVWAGFSLLAAAVQFLLVQSGLISAMGLALGSRRIAGLLLIAAGLYQLTPLKRACLAACRSPLSFLTRLWRPGWAGALRLGFAHGLYCLGCCWLLMALLFVGGVMNLAWVAALAILVLIEKVAPIGDRFGAAVGVVVTVAGLGLAVAG
jgi:predicted metal-binding membrane protein